MFLITTIVNMFELITREKISIIFSCCVSPFNSMPAVFCGCNEDLTNLGLTNFNFPL